MNANRHPYSLRNFLRAQLREPGTTKGGRTRINLMLAAVETLDEMTYEWHSRVTATIDIKMAGRKLSESDQLLLGYSHGGMADKLLRQIFILKTPYLKACRPVNAACELTEVLSLLWYRAIFGEDPNPKAMQEAKVLV